MIIVTKDDSGKIDDDTLMYFGSHNFSTNAWGKLEKQGTQFTIANWELGVAFLPGDGSKDNKLKIVENLNVKFPPEKYQFGDIPFFGDVEYN